MTITTATAAAAVQNGTIKLPAKLLDLHFENDVGLAEMMAERFRGQILYLRDLKEWMGYSPDHGWKLMDEVGITALAIQFAREMRQKGREAANGLEADAAAKILARYSALGMKKRIGPALDFARATPGLAIHSTSLDTDKLLVGTPNGILNLADGSFRPFSFDSRVTKRIGTQFDPAAQAPHWDRFLSEVQPDPEMRAFLQRLMGYTLTGHTRDHILPFHYGRGGNGKGTFFEKAMRPLFGDYAATLSSNLTCKGKVEKNNDVEVHQIAGKRFLMGTEMERATELNEHWLKGATGEDMLKGRGLYRSHFEYRPTGKIHLVGNHKPVIVSTDPGFWRRFIMVPWTVEIPAERRDLSLTDKIYAELPGILNWVVQGAQDWLRHGINIPASCQDFTVKHREDSDRLLDFFDAKLVRNPDTQVSKSAVFDAYLDWCEHEGINRPMSKRSLGMALDDRGWIEHKDREGTRHWSGWRLRNLPD